MNPIALMDAIVDVYDNAAFRPRDGKTFCNQAVHAVAQNGFGFKEFKGKTANDIVALISTSKKWDKVPGFIAQEKANAGCLAIAGKQDTPHGHVCVIRPSQRKILSGKWGKDVPQVMNIGADCFISQGTNYAFKDEPGYWYLVCERK